MTRNLSERELKLLMALRDYEENRTVVDIGDLQRKSGYKPATLKTYVNKKLEGNLLRRRADDSYIVDGAVACSEERFAELMSQKTIPASPVVGEVGTEEEWGRALEALIDIAIERGYAVEPAAAEILIDLVK